MKVQPIEHGQTDYPAALIDRLGDTAIPCVVHFEAEFTVDLSAARKEVGPFVNNPDALTLWSEEFFHAAFSSSEREGRL